MIRATMVFLTLLAALSAHANDLAKDLAPTGTLRATYIATNPVQAFIGFVAFDPVRASHVDFSQNYALAQNTYIVSENSPIRSVADADRAGVRIGVGARDAGDYFLSRTLKHAELKRNEGGIGDAAVKLLLGGELEAYAGNRMRLHAVT